MLVKDLLSDICFTESQQSRYLSYREMASDRIGDVAKDYMQGDITFATALELVHSYETAQLHRYTLDLIFVLECSSFLLERYDREGVSREIFYDSMKDVKYKLDECLKIHNVFGISSVAWYEFFLEMKRFSFGRLQFNLSEFERDDVTVKGYTVKRGDFTLACHIPSSGPLKPEMCKDSFERAYDFFKDRTPCGILPITCGSWLFYPPYKEVFDAGSNTYEFIDNFELIHEFETEKFADAWRIFGMDYDGDPDRLPADTSMQRRLIDYIRRGGNFGRGVGLALVDSTGVLTKKE